MIVLQYHSMSCVCFGCRMEDTFISPEYGGGAGTVMDIKVITK